MKSFLIGLLTVVMGFFAQAQPLCAPIVNLSGNINSDRTLDKDTLYRVNGCVQMTNNSTLTIQAGTVIEYQNNSILMIREDAQIQALGTAMDPIIMTSGATTPNGRSMVTNAGLVIVGNAPVNGGATLSLPCSETLTIGNAPTSSSGTVQYLQLHYLSGTTTGNFEHAFSLAGVGSGTTLDHIQITHSGQNGLGIIGGLPVIENLFVLNTAVHDIHVTGGAQTQLTEVLTLHKDCSLKSAAGTHSLYVANHPSLPSSTPEVMVTMDQATLLGPLHCGCEPDADFQNGILLTNNAGLALTNAVVSGFNGAGIFIDDQITADNTDIGRVVANNSSFINNTLDYDYNPAITWIGNGCGTDMSFWIDGSGPTSCTQEDNEFGSFVLGYDGSICDDFCSETPEFTTTGSTTIPFIDGSVTIRRGAIQATDLFAHITACPYGAVYCTPVPLFRSSPASSLEVYPNPATQQAFIAFDAAAAGSATIIVRELVTGRILYQGVLSIPQSGARQVAVPVSGWKEGVYPVQLITPQQMLQGKISIR
jgi:hypothetical protein